MIEFDKTSAQEIVINDGLIKSIWLECTTFDSKSEGFDSDGVLELFTGENALIEFVNGKNLLITNSEWSFLSFLNKKQIKQK